MIKTKINCKTKKISITNFLAPLDISFLVAFMLISLISGFFGVMV